MAGGIDNQEYKDAINNLILAIQNLSKVSAAIVSERINTTAENIINEAKEASQAFRNNTKIQELLNALKRLSEAVSALKSADLEESRRKELLEKLEALQASVSQRVDDLCREISERMAEIRDVLETVPKKRTE